MTDSKALLSLNNTLLLLDIFMIWLINKITSKETILNYVKHNTLPVYNTDLHNIIHCIWLWILFGIYNQKKTPSHSDFEMKNRNEGTIPHLRKIRVAICLPFSSPLAGLAVKKIICEHCHLQDYVSHVPYYDTCIIFS